VFLSLAREFAELTGDLTSARTYVPDQSGELPYTRSPRALKTRNLTLVIAAAAELPCVGLQDGLQVCQPRGDGARSRGAQRTALSTRRGKRVPPNCAGSTD
jgi:hypothetical protein